MSRIENSLAALRSARAVIESPSAWRETVGTYAETQDGRLVASRHPEASIWSLLGAIAKSIPIVEHRAVEYWWPTIHALERFVGREHDGDIGLWLHAEGRTHADVLELVDKAIKRLEAEARVRIDSGENG